MNELYNIDGLEFITHHTPTIKALNGCEFLTYKTPLGSEFVIAKDGWGTQICKDGCFFPTFIDFGSINSAVDYLRQNTLEAIAFFDRIESLVKK